MNLYYNTTAQCRVDEFNTRIAAKPILHYGACPVWELHFYSGDPSETPEAVDLSDIVSCRAAVDSDWNSTTEPMCRTLAADIDMSRKAQGIISVPVNANTQRYLTVVTGKQSVGAWFELRGFDDQGNVSLVVLLNITCNNSIDPTGGAEPEPVDNDTATMTWVKAEIAQQLYFQYSEDGSTWHAPPMVSGTDVYFRVKHGQDGTPSAAQVIPYGPEGEQGPQGETGATGPQGPQGETGPTGPAGADGADGADGTDGADGITPHIGNNGDWYLGDTDTGVKAEISGSYVSFSAVDSSGNYTLAGTTTVPYAVLTNAGNFYPVEKGSVTVDSSLNTITVNVAPYLAYDNAATFSGTWRLYFAAGSSEVVFNGMPYVALTGAASVTIPVGGSAYTLTIGQDTTITFPSPGNATCYFWLYLTTGATVYTVTLPTNISWDDGNGPALNSASSLYRFAFLWDVPTQKWLGSLFWPAEVLT